MRTLRITFVLVIFIGVSSLATEITESFQYHRSADGTKSVLCLSSNTVIYQYRDQMPGEEWRWRFSLGFAEWRGTPEVGSLTGYKITKSLVSDIQTIAYDRAQQVFVGTGYRPRRFDADIADIKLTVAEFVFPELEWFLFDLNSEAISFVTESEAKLRTKNYSESKAIKQWYTNAVKRAKIRSESTEVKSGRAIRSVGVIHSSIEFQEPSGVVENGTAAGSK